MTRVSDYRGSMHPGDLGRKVGGTHPTGMFSCFKNIFIKCAM